MTVLVAIVGGYALAYGEDENTYDRTWDRVNRPGSAYDADLVVIQDDVRRETHGTDRASIVIPDMAQMLSDMRNEAVRQTLAGNYSHLCLIENDVLLRRRTIEQLMDCDVDIVGPVPRVASEFFTRRLFWPHPAVGAESLWPVEWMVISALLYSCEALEKVEPFFEGIAEGQMFTRWQEAGLETFVDLDTPVDILEIPHGFMHTVSTPEWQAYDARDRALEMRGEFKVRMIAARVGVRITTVQRWFAEADEKAVLEEVGMPTAIGLGIARAAR